MSTSCGVCCQNPPKYKCPTCQLPYCSIPCFKSHKASEHSSNTAPDSAPSPETHALASDLPRTPQAGDFSTLVDHPAIQALFTSHPTLRDDLRRVYAATIAPDPSQQQEHQEQRGGGAHSGRGYRGGGRGRGYGTRGRGGGRGGRDNAPWTPKKGEKAALYMLGGVRSGKWDGDAEGMKEFVKLVGEIYGGADPLDNQVEEDGD